MSAAILALIQAAPLIATLTSDGINAIQQFLANMATSKTIATQAQLDTLSSLLAQSQAAAQAADDEADKLDTLSGTAL